jgi:hypothetical protein
MSAHVLFIGTSFLGAIKQGYEDLHHHISGSGAATFVGLNAPELVANLRSGWSIDNGRLEFSPDLSCFVSSLEYEEVERSAGSKTFPGSTKVSGLDIDLRRYRSIVFVDMFYRLRPSFLVNEKSFPVVEGVPLSKSLLSELQSNGFNGWISLAQHPQYGNIPFVNAKQLLTAIREAIWPVPTFLLSAPRPPLGNVDVQARYGDVACARRSFDYLEHFYEKELARYGIEYLSQPAEVLDEDGCLTRLEYSRGAHPTKAGVADEHMNRAYGEAILTKYAERIFGRG